MDKQIEQEQYVVTGEEIAKRLLDEFSPEEQRRTLETASGIIANHHKQAIEHSKAKLEDAHCRLDEFLNGAERKEVR